MDNRKYDINLVYAIREKEYTRNENGIDVTYKPIPDDDRAGVLDPRLRNTILMKQKMFSDKKARGWTLSSERYRPDKVTYDLTTVEVETREFLINIDNDHMIDLYEYRRKDDEGKKLPVLVYFHGGGFTAGDNKLYCNQMKLIAEKAHAAVYFPEYRLAPECPFPGAINDATGAINYIYDHAEELCIDKDKIMVAGDSAGGSLTNACVLKDDRGIITKIFEMYPAWDMRKLVDIKEYEWSYDLYEVIEEDKPLAYSRIDRIKSSADNKASSSANLYLQGKAQDDNPLVSAYCASDEQLAKFPKAVIAVSEYDYLTVGVKEAVKRLHSLNKDVRLIVYKGTDHGFFDMLGTTIQAEEMCLTIADELNNM